MPKFILYITVSHSCTSETLQKTITGDMFQAAVRSTTSDLRNDMKRLRSDAFVSAYAHHGLSEESAQEVLRGENTSGAPDTMSARDIVSALLHVPGKKKKGMFGAESAKQANRVWNAVLDAFEAEVLALDPSRATAPVSCISVH